MKLDISDDKKSVSSLNFESSSDSADKHSNSEKLPYEYIDLLNTKKIVISEDKQAVTKEKRPLFVMRKLLITDESKRSLTGQKQKKRLPRNYSQPMIPLKK